MSRWWQKLKGLMDRAEYFVVDVVYDRRRGRRVLCLAAILWGLSQIFKIVVRVRTVAYRERWCRSQYLGCVVVVVGNMTVGGTGKTPIVEKIARALSRKGRRVAILSRGYKSKTDPPWKRLWRWMTHSDPPQPKIVSDGKRLYLDSENAGDEPYLLAKNLQNVGVLVDKDRVKAGNYAIRKLGADVLVLDDGFQYLQLNATYYLTLVDATNPFGNGHVLPRGPMREPLRHIRRSSYIFLTKVDEVSPQRLESLKKQILRYHPTARFIECAHTPLYLQEIFTERRRPLDDLKDLCVATLSGIAAPEGFERFLRYRGVRVVFAQRCTDHYRFTDNDMEHFYDGARISGAECLITTEKDAVRLPTRLRPTLPFYFLRMEIEIVNGQGQFERVVEEISCSHFAISESLESPRSAVAYVAYVA
jgi:tetraacyldisaccharide 4'-kinase